MSLSFEIFPTKKKIPNCDEVIKCSVQLFSEFLEKENISCSLNIIISEVTSKKNICTNPVSLVLNENGHTVFNVNEEGEVYVFYHELTDLDRDFIMVQLSRQKSKTFIMN